MKMVLERIGNKVLKSNLKNILYIGVDESDIMVGINRRDSVFKVLEKSSDLTIEEIKSDFSSFEKTEELIYEYLKEKSLNV